MRQNWKKNSSYIFGMEPSTRNPQRKVRLVIDVFYFMKVMESDDKRLEAMRNASDGYQQMDVFHCR